MRNLHSFFPRLSPLYVTLGSILTSPTCLFDIIGGYLIVSGVYSWHGRITCSPIFSPTPPAPFYSCQQMHFVFQSDCGRRWIESLRKRTNWFFSLTRTFFCFSPQVHFLSVDIKGFQKSFDIALFFFFFFSLSLHSSAATQLHFPKQDLCWRTALSVFFCQGPLLLIIHCLTLSDPAVVTGFTTRSLVVLQGEVSQDEQVTDRWIQT